MSDEPRDGITDGSDSRAPEPSHDVAAGTSAAAEGGLSSRPGPAASPMEGLPDGVHPDPAGTDVGPVDESQPVVSHADDTRTDVSAPWERPQRWKRGVSESIGVEALLAKLAAPGGPDADVPGDEAAGVDRSGAAVPDTGQSRRAAEDGNPPPTGDPNPAGQLIAASAAPVPDDGQAAPANPTQTPDNPAQTPESSAQTPDNPGQTPESSAQTPEGPGPGEEPDARSDSVDTSASTATPPPAPPAPPSLPGDVPRRGSGIPPRRHRALLYAGRSVAAVVALATLLSVGFYWNIKDRAEVGLVDHQVTGALITDDPSISTARTTQMVVTNSKGVKTTEAAAPKATYKPENILLLGSDTRSGANAALGGTDPSTNGTSNSDTLMVAHVSGDREHVTILSIPRDSLIPAPHCKSWNPNTGAVSTADFPVDPGEIFHINSAYAVGGPRCTITAVQSLTGLGITRMIGIDFQGFESMVSALGGITVNICRPIVDQVLGTVAPKAGVQVVQGGQALGLVRARDVIGDTESDLARIHRQQVVLSAILRQVTQAGTLLNAGRLDNFLQAFTKSTFTQNVTLEDLVTLAGSLGSLDPAHVTFYTLPTTPSTTVDGALDVDRARAAVVFDDLINDLPLPGEATKSPKPKPVATTGTPPISADLAVSVAPARVVLEIYNGSGQDSAAAMARQKLNAAGFKVTDGQLFTSDSIQKSTVVEFATTNRAAGLTVAAAVPGSTLVVTPGLGNTVRLLLGTSFSGTVKAVKVGQQAPASLSTAISTGPDVSTGSGGPTPKSTSLSSVNAAAGTCV